MKAQHPRVDFNRWQHTRSFRAIAWLVIWSLLFLGAPAPTWAQALGTIPVQGSPVTSSVQIGNYTLVKTERVTRTLFDFTYTATLTNTGNLPLPPITATLTSSTPVTTVIDGSVSFGALQPGATLPGQDTFTIRQDRTVAFDPSKLLWTLNVRPVADAGPDQTLFVTQTVQLDGSGSSDLDGQQFHFQWTLMSAPAGSIAQLSDPTAVKPTLTIDKPGRYELQLIVNDGQLNSALDTVVLNTENSRPVADAGPDQTVLVGQRVFLDGSNSKDVDGDVLRYLWTLIDKPATSTATLDNADTVSPSFIIDKPGKYTVQLIVNDGQLSSLPNTVILSTENSKPVANAGPDQMGEVGKPITLDGTGSSDADGDPLTYQWSFPVLPPGCPIVQFVPTDPILTFTPTCPGMYVVQLVVHDGKEFSEPDTVTITVKDVVSPHPPIADAGPDQMVNVGATVKLDGSGSSDPDGDTLSFEWEFSLKPASSNAVLQNAATAMPSFVADVAGTYTLKLTVRDGRGGSAEDFVTITATTNQAPVITSVPVTQCVIPPGVEAGSSVTLNATVRDFLDSHPDFEKGISNLVTGLVQTVLGPDRKPIFAGANGAGAITSADTFTQWFTDVAGVNQRTVLPLTLIETAPGSKIYSFSSGGFFPIDGQLFGNQGRSHNYHFTLELHTQFTYRGGEVFQFTGDDDVWVFINNRLAVDLGGVHPQASGSVNLDLLGLTVGGTYTFDLFFAERHTSESNFHLQTSVTLEPSCTYSYDVEAHDDDNDPLTYSLVSSPSGMRVDPATGLITWNPGSDQVGTFPVTVLVEDGRGGSDEQRFDVTVEAENRRPVATNDAFGTAVNNALVVPIPGVLGNDSDVNGDPLTAHLVSGPTHGALTLNQDGSFSYTPNNSFRGKDSFTYKANDGQSDSNTAKVTIAVGDFCDIPGPVPPTTSSNFTDPTPTVIPSPTEMILRKELSGYGNYGAADGKSDILYTSQAATWHFTLPSSVDPATILGAFFRVTLIADDHYDVDPTNYKISIWTNNEPQTSNCPANLPHGAPFGGRFSNWVVQEYEASIAPAKYTLTIANRSATASGHWLAVDWIELHLVTSGNHQPTIISTPVTLATVDQLYTYDVEATDQDGDTLTYSLTTAPTGMMINTATGLIQWTPAANQVPSQDVTVSVSDGKDATPQSFTIAVSTAPITVPVPDVVGQTQTAAETAITTANLTVGTITKINSSTVPAGNVISQSPTAGTLVPPQTAVDLTVSLGPASQPVTVPDVVGQTQTDAEAMLIDAKLKPGTTTTVDSDASLNFTSLPSAQGWAYGAFGNNASETQVFSVNSNVLQQNTLGLGVNEGLNLYQLHDVVQPTLPFTLTVTARVLQDEGDPTDAFGFGFGVVMGNEQFALGLRTNGIRDSSGTVLSTTIDTTQFHEYHLEGAPGLGFRVFVDGVLLGTGTTSASSASVPFLLLGDLSDTANARVEITGFSFVQNAGKVIAQQPAAGTSVAEGIAVDLTVVKAPENVTVPDVVGQTQADAIAALIAAKLLVGPLTTQNSPTVPKGNVISQTPARGTTVPEHTAASLVISLGPETSPKVTVPNVVGLAQADAEAAIVAAKLSKGAVTTASSPTVPAGKVISQSPAADASVPQGSPVDLIVSTGPPQPICPLSSILVQPTDPLLLVGQTQAFTAIGICNDNTSQNLNGQVVWGSSATNVATIDGTGTASALAEGTTTISATLGSIIGSTTLTVKAAVADTTLPTAAITAPANDATITSPTDIVGTASDANFFKYALEYAPVGETNFTPIVTGTTPVTNGVLGQLDPTLLINDLYTIRLTVYDRANNSTTVEVRVQVSREQKVGNFTLAFQDLSVPVAGLPITVVRTYDSRDKGKGDFGIGWRLDIQTLRLRVNREQGSAWQVNRSGFTYTLVPTDAHRVTISLPDGRVEEFDLTPSPSSQGGPLLALTANYSKRPGSLTRGSLVPLDERSLVILDAQPGLVDLLLESDPTVIYDPQQFQYTTPEGQVIIIDRTAGVQSVTDLNGNKLTFGPNGITHSSGKGVTFTRDAQQRITQITDPKGNTQSYTYDANGDLKSHTDATGNTTSFLYNFRHDLIEIKDPRGIRPVRNEYDDAGRLIKHIDAFGKEITYTHNIGVREEIITDRLGQITKHEYDDKGNVVRTTDANGGVTERTYDTRGNTLSEKDPLGRTRTYTYDANDNRTSEADPLGNTTSYTYNSRNQVEKINQPGSGTTTNTYDANGNLTSTKDPLGKTTTYTYNTQGLQLTQTDPLGNVTTYRYNSIGNLTSETNPLGHVTTYEYDANGNRTKQTTTKSGETLVTSYQYDQLNRLVRTTFPDGSSTQTAYNSIGKQSATVDQGGRQTSYQYNDLGRLTKTTYPDGTSESSTYDAEGRRTESTDRAGRITKYAYDALGRLTVTTAPDGSTTSTFYDVAGQVTSTTDALGHGTTYQYDLAGRRTKVTDALGKVTTFVYDAAGNQTSMTDANNHTASFAYDANNRRTGVTYADGTGESTIYDALGRTISKTDQGGKTTQFAYDKLGRLVKVTDALGQETTYTYDELGNQLTQTDANNHTTRFEYDKLGRRTKRILPLDQTETSTYDAAGNQVSKTDFNGKTTNYAYDAVNRLTSKTPDPTLSPQAVTFSYTATGQRASMSDASGATNYTYDNRDRLISKATPQGTLTYTYDAAGNLKSIDSSNANGVSVDYEHDALNRLSKVTDNRLASGVTTYSYDNVGNLASYLYPNGVQSSYTYSTINRLTNLTISKATTIGSFAYTLGAAGNRTAVTEHSGRTVNYSYDSLYRLTNETISNDPAGINGSIGYTYDPVGNRQTRTSTVAGIPNQTFTYDANDRLSNDTYDSNGNTTGSDSKTYDYDFENHLTNQNGSGVVIVYDGDGNRVSKTVGGVTTQYLVDDRNHTGYAQVLEEIVNGTVERVYTYGLDLISQNQPSGVSFYGYDGHGSVRLLTDVNGNVTDTYTYEAFGNVIDSTGNTSNNYLYAGEQSDPNVGFYYLRARYLNAAIGRFATTDPYEGSVFDPISLHKYAYARNDPVNYTDPSGQFSLTEISVVTAIVGALVGISAYRLLSPKRTLIGYILAGTGGALVGAALPYSAIAVSVLARTGYFIGVHAVARMLERGIGIFQIVEAIRYGARFPYPYEATFRVGYFLESTGVFVATAGSRITTVFLTSSRYVLSLIE